MPELENCHSHGDTPEEAIRNVKEAIDLWLETARDESIPIPEPLGRKKFSGKFVVRAPEDLHATLAQEALRRGRAAAENKKSRLDEAAFFGSKLAERAGLEPAAFRVTGGRYNQLN
jgi:predicted RNase H-like HicB family nuclease